VLRALWWALAHEGGLRGQLARLCAGNAVSARLTVERGSAQVKPYHVDHLGYSFCGACADCGREPRQYGFLRPNEEMPMPPGEVQRCDGCGKPSAAWPLEEIHGTVVVEHPTCRIY